MSMKNSDDTIWNRTSDLPICSTVPYPLCHRGPLIPKVKKDIKVHFFTHSSNSCKLYQGKRLKLLRVTAVGICVREFWETFDATTCYRDRDMCTGNSGKRLKLLRVTAKEICVQGILGNV
jgi:hypothetical protein